MGITVEKARKVLKTYRENDYNASKALKEVGYTEQTAEKASRTIINGAIRKIAKEEVKNLATSDNPLDLLLGIISMSEKDVTNEYVKIIKQDKDLSTKLKAMLPLLNKLGFKWDENQTKVTVPILNITTETILGEQLGQKDTIDVAQSTLSDIDRG